MSSTDHRAGSELQTSSGTVRRNRSGEMDTYTGVSIAALLQASSPKTKATAVVFVAEHGSIAEASLSDVLQCETCTLSFRTKGGFSIAMPSFPTEIPVRGVVEIQVKLPAAAHGAR
jgi:hypothetical protein